MTRRALILLVAVVLVAVAAAAALGCASSGATTTTAATIAPDTTGGSDSSGSASSDTNSSTGDESTSSSAATEESDQLSTTTSAKQTGTSANYPAQMKAWVKSLSGMPDTQVFDVTDPAHVTAAQIAAAKDAAAKAHKYLDVLNKLKPTTQLADLHRNIVRAFQGLVAAFDSYLIALQQKSADGVAESKEVGQAAEAELEKYFTQLAPKIGLSG
jgi:hypothetical protein